MISVHPETFTVVTRGDNGIIRFEDLKGKRVNVGTPGSGQRAAMEVVTEAFGIGMDDLALATEYKGSEMAKQLRDGNIDAMIYTIGHPAAAIKERPCVPHLGAEGVGNPQHRASPQMKCPAGAGPQRKGLGHQNSKAPVLGKRTA